MSNVAGAKSAAPGERRFQVVVTTDRAGVEHLEIKPVIDLAEAPPLNIPHAHLVQLACRIYDTRRARTRYFNGSMFGEPAWDMLLALFCLPSRGERLTVSSLSLAAEVPPTTGLRCARKMEREGLIERSHDPKDGRRVYTELTTNGEQLMRDFLSAIYHRLTTA